MNIERKIKVIEPIATLVQEDKTVSPEKLRVAAYARVSTEQDEQESSYEAQVDYYTRHIKSNPDWEFVDIYADRGITGTNTKNRERFNQMINDALSGKIDLILTKSISRFARNTVDTLQTVRKLKASGVEVVFEKENLHTFDPKCEVMLTIMSSLAQEESRSISENIRWAQQKNMQNGIVHVAYSRFLGYRKGENGRLEIIEEEATIVRQIYDLFLSGKTIRNIADKLTADGIPTPSGKKKWSVSTIRSILSNEKYKGDALLQKTYTVDYLSKEVRKNEGEVRQYLVENSHDPIIDPELFNQVQQKLAKHCVNRTRLRCKSPLANTIVCAECGGYYGHKVWHNQLNTNRYDMWYCNHRYDKEYNCQTPYLRESEIKAALVTALQQAGHPETEYSDELWRTMVESATVSQDRKITFLFSDQTEAVVRLNN